MLFLAGTLLNHETGRDNGSYFLRQIAILSFVYNVFTKVEVGHFNGKNYNEVINSEYD